MLVFIPNSPWLACALGVVVLLSVVAEGGSLLRLARLLEEVRDPLSLVLCALLFVLFLRFAQCAAFGCSSRWEGEGDDHSGRVRLLLWQELISHLANCCACVSSAVARGKLDAADAE